MQNTFFLSGKKCQIEPSSRIGKDSDTTGREVAGTSTLGKPVMAPVVSSRSSPSGSAGDTSNLRAQRLAAPQGGTQKTSHDKRVLTHA